MKLLPYPKYKQSGVEWLGEVPAHWEVRTLTSIANEITTGPFGSQLHASEYVEDRIPVVNPAHIVAGSIRPDIFSSVDDATALRLERHRLKQHDVIVGRRGEIGRCAVVGRQEDGWLCGTGALVVRLHNSDPRYILAVFSGAGFREVLSLNAVGTTMLNLNPMIVGRMLSPVPPLPEQRAIADFLHRETSRLDTLVAKKRTLIERLKEKRTALISRAVTRGLPPDAARAAGLDPDPKLKPSGIKWLGDVPEHWEVKPLGRLVRFAGGATPDKGKPEYWDGDIPWVSPKDMKRMRIDDVPNHVSREGLSSSALTLMPAQSVLIVVRGMILAHSFPVAITGAPVTINQDMKALTSGKRLNAEFLLWLLTGIAGIFVSLADESAHGTRKLESEIVARVRVALPSTDEQISIVDFLDRETAKIDALVAKIETAIERLHEYRAALITEAVTGKIDVRGAVVPEEDAA